MISLNDVTIYNHYSPDVFEKKLSVKSIAEVILPAATKEDFTFIDSSIGKQTTFTFDMAYDQGAEVVLTSPSGSVIDKTSKEYTYDAAFRAIQISLNKAEVSQLESFINAMIRCIVMHKSYMLIHEYIRTN